MSAAAPDLRKPPATLTALALTALGGIALLLAFVTMWALPTAATLAKAGDERERMAPCEVLQPQYGNATLGNFPVAAPDFSLKDVRGRDFQLSMFRGQVVLLNFWATWCPPCVDEVPSLEQLTVKMRGKLFRLLAVSVDENWDTVGKFFAKGSPLDVLLDTPKATSQKYGTSKFPETYLIDKQGRVRLIVVNKRDWSEPAIEQCFESLMKED